MRWTVSVPVWGDSYAHRFLLAWPAIQASIAAANPESVAFIAHTDRPEWITALLRDYPVTCRPMPEGKLYEAFGTAHRVAVELATVGDAVMLLGADLVPSVETFAVCERILGRKRLVMTTGLRTCSVDAPPAGATGSELRDWMLARLHPANFHNFWGRGYYPVPWGLFFETEDSLVLRAFHLHPLAFIKTEGLTFEHTCDEGLPSKFAREDIHVETDPAHFCIAELSPPDKANYRTNGLATTRRIALWAKGHAKPVHRWFFAEHRILLRGDGHYAGDSVVARQVMAQLGWNGPVV